MGHVIGETLSVTTPSNVRVIVQPVVINYVLKLVVSCRAVYKILQPARRSVVLYREEQKGVRTIRRARTCVLLIHLIVCTHIRMVIV